MAYDNGQFFANLEATKEIKDLKILSQPRLLTAENQKAEISIGKKQPIVSTATAVSTGRNQKPVTKTSIDWKDIGIELNITPRINANRDVSLDFKLQITAIISTTGVMGQQKYPVIGHRIISNSSTVMDKEMLVIGGLVKEEKKVAKNKVPFFGEVPFMGWLFSTTSEEAEQTELLFFIKPHVIESTEEGNNVTKIVTKDYERYDKDRAKEIKKMINGERDNSWNVFNLYQYFNNGEYKGEQDVIPQEWGSFRN